MPTSVGFSTGTFALVRSFSRQRRISQYSTSVDPHHASGLTSGGFAYLTPYTLGAARPPAARPTLLRHSLLVTNKRGAGILTGCPLPTSFDLGLGPALPWVENTCPGNLRLSAEKILTSLYATHAGIRTSDTSTASHDTASQAYRTLPYHYIAIIQSFGTRLEPRYIFGAR